MAGLWKKVLAVHFLIIFLFTLSCIMLLYASPDPSTAGTLYYLNILNIRIPAGYGEPVRPPIS